MSTNLLSQISGLLEGELTNKLASLVGGSSHATKTAIGATLPRLINGFSESASTPTGAERMLSLIQGGNHDGSILDNLSDLLSGGSETEVFLNSGKSLLHSILGSKSDSMLDGLGGFSSLGRSGNSTLMSALAPILMGSIGKLVKGSNLTASGLQNLLSSEAASLPGMNLGNQTPKIKSGGILKWLIPVLLGVGLIWFLSRSCTSTSTSEDDTNMEQTDLGVGEGSGIVLSVDDAGNLVDQTGKILAEAGKFSISVDGIVKDIEGTILFPGASFSGTIPEIKLEGADLEKEVGYYIDDAGNLVDKTGKVIVKAGEFEEKDGYYVDKQGNILGRILGKFVAAVKDAAETVGNAFKDLFSNKDKIGSLYTLQKMEFNPEDHLITSYSQQEVMNLAEALKEYPDSKIEIHNYTADAGNKKAENKNISSLRAQVLESMLTTLGVNKKQISTKGMGSNDETKAAANTMEILVK